MGPITVQELCRHVSGCVVTGGGGGGGATLEYCTYRSEVYSVGESWLVDECTQCSCVDPAQVLCSVTVCELSSLADCTSASLHQFCCPICHSQSLPPPPSLGRGARYCDGRVCLSVHLLTWGVATGVYRYIYPPPQNQSTLQIFMWLLVVFFYLTQDKLSLILKLE